MSLITTHVLDNSTGAPAAGMRATLTDQAGATLGTGVTDQDGRVSALGPESLEPGIYRLHFSTGEYFRRTSTPAFFPEVSISFEVGTQNHYHVPLLLSPFAYSTYRGS